MRIIAGKNRHRNLETLEGLTTRPMMDRMKEAVFSHLGGMFQGGEVLDCFAGSGALSLEALSRGMDYATLIEIDRNAQKVIKNNIASLHEEDQTTLIPLSYEVVLPRLIEQGKSYDLIFLDPPFRMAIINDILVKIKEGHLCKVGGRICCQYLKEHTQIQAPDGFEVTKEMHYAVSSVTILKRVE